MKYLVRRPEGRFSQSPEPEVIVAWTRCQPWKWGVRSVPGGCIFRILLMALMRTVMQTGVKDDPYI